MSTTTNYYFRELSSTFSFVDIVMQSKQKLFPPFVKLILLFRNASGPSRTEGTPRIGDLILRNMKQIKVCGSITFQAYIMFLFSSYHDLAFVRNVFTSNVFKYVWCQQVAVAN